MANNSKILISLLVLVITGILLYLGITYKVPPQTAAPITPQATVPVADPNVVADVVFTCPANKSIHAVFTKDGMAALTLSDGRTMTLPHALSADGARFANADESFVFWNKGNGAFIEENGATTYDNCETPPLQQ